MKKISILIITMFFWSASIAQEKINWIGLEEAYGKIQENPKKVIVDVYTSWCGWCKVMDKNTFSNPEVAKYINENYYAVKFDAESQKEIKIGPNVYKYDAGSKSNQAAIALLQGKMSYPSIVYLDEKFNMIQPIPGYMNAKDFHELITFFGGNFHKTDDYEKYKKEIYPAKYKDLKL